MAKQNVGFIGLGVMGWPMAHHLAKAGYGMTVYDLSQDALGRLKAEHPGVTIAATPKEVASASEIVITMLPSGKPVNETVFGENGLAKGFKPGSLLLDTSSSEPWYTRETAEGLAKIGVAMVDAPVSGAEMGAKAAELVFMVGADDASLARVKPLLDVMGKKIFHLGPVTAGHTMKSINNLITAVTFMATAEGLVIGKGRGLDPAVMNEVLNVSTGMSWISKTHIDARILSRKFDDPFKLDLMMKDIDIALRTATESGRKVPLSAKTQDLWHEIQASIPKGSSVSELVRSIEKNNGVEIVSPTKSG